MAEHESDTPLVYKKENGLLGLTEEGVKELETMVTSVDGQVYAFKPGVDTTTAAAGMARLSRSPNDFRAIIADEFINQGAENEELIRRVVTNYGDDSVMQLDSLQAVFEGVSQPAAKAIEHGRAAAGYLEQSSRYIRFDHVDEDGHYRYYTPEEFDDDTKAEYEENLNEVMGIYTDLYMKVREYIRITVEQPSDEKNRQAWLSATNAQALDSVRGLLPAAAKSTVGMAGSTQAFYNMILRMEAHPLPEVKKLGRQVLEAVRMVQPVFFERVDMPDRGGLISDNKETTRENSRELANEILERAAGLEQEQGPYVKLLSSEGSENELIAKILADHSSLAFGTILSVVEDLSDAEKQQVLDTYVGERYNRRVKPGRAFELPHYLFEVQCDFGAYRDIQRGRMVDGFNWQALQPNLGHARPAIIDEAGLTDEFERAFAISHETYDMLRERGYDDQAQYATLFGHNMRFTFMINARSLFHSAELRTTPQGHPSYRKVFMDMVEQVSEVHPFVTRYMTHLNKSEDEQLARLGAEIAKQRRLEALGVNSQESES